MRSLYPLLIVATATLGLADTLTLKDGRIVAGTYLGGTSRQVRMEVSDRIESYDVSDVARIEFQPTASPAPQPRETAPPPRDRVRLLRPDDSAAPTPAPTPAPAARSLTIPSGTVLRIRMIDGV